MISQSWILATSATRTHLSDRKTLFSQFSPGRVVMYAVQRFAIANADYGNSLITKYGDDDEMLERQQAAWLNPWHPEAPQIHWPWLAVDRSLRAAGRRVSLLPTAAMSRRDSDSDDSHDFDDDESVVVSPWPDLFTKTFYGTARDMSIVAVTWGLEELAIRYVFDEKTCDRLTKDVYSSGKRKMERSDSMLDFTQQFLITHLAGTCLRWSAVFCVNSMTAFWSAVFPYGVYHPEDARFKWNQSMNSPFGMHIRNGVPPFPTQALKHFVNDTLSWIIESCSASLVVTLASPLSYGGKMHKYAYTMMNTLFFGIGGICIREPVMKALF